MVPAWLVAARQRRLPVCGTGAGQYRIRGYGAANTPWRNWVIIERRSSITLATAPTMPWLRLKKDYGLPVNGVASVADQQVLFADRGRYRRPANHNHHDRQHNPHPHRTLLPAQHPINHKTQQTTGGPYGAACFRLRCYTTTANTIGIVTIHSSVDKVTPLDSSASSPPYCCASITTMLPTRRCHP